MKNALRAILAIIILITGTYALFGYSQEQKDNKVYEGVEQYINSFADPNEIVIFPGQDETGLEIVSKYQQSYDWEGLLNINKDIVGWLYIPDNDVINFPIVKGSNNSYYLNHDYTKKWNGDGAAFVDYKNNKYSLSKVIYGHNMSLSSTKPIFTTIVNWKDEEYFNSHRTLYYTDANGMTKKYLIVALAHFNVAAKEEYSYLDTMFETEEDFRGWIEYIKEHSRYYDLGDNTIDYRADEVMVLSTCDRKLGYSSNGRSILFCVNLTNNELDREMD